MVNQDSKDRIDKYIKENPECEQRQVVPIVLKEERKEIPVYRLPIELLYYNIRNGRFAAEYKSLLKKHGGELKAEDPNDAKKIKDLLLSLDPSETSVTYDDIKARGQWVPGIITEDGYVIDGNRRMAIITKLFEDTADGKFKYLLVGKPDEQILAPDLWKLEASIQLGKDQIVKYGPINELLKLHEGISAGISTKEIAKTLYGIDDVSEIEEKLDRLELIKEYLNFIDQPDDFEVAKGYHEHFIRLQEIIAAEKKMGTEPDLRVTIKQIVFQLILDGIQHLELRDIKKMVRLHLADSINELKKAKEYSKPKSSSDKEAEDKDKDAKKGEDKDAKKGEDEDKKIASPTLTYFRNAADILDAEENKDQVLQLLKKAEVNLKAIDPQSDDLKKSESKEMIRKILNYVDSFDKTE